MQVVIRPQDIPPQGRHFDFDLDSSQLNERVAEVRKVADHQSLMPPSYVFNSAPKASLKVYRRGNSVEIHGSLFGAYSTPCSRCAEDTEVKLDVPVNITLEKSAGKEGEQDDVAISYYVGEEIELQSVVEEFAVLALPFSVLCSEGCKGLCTSCGANLNSEMCACPPPEGDERFAVLRGLKIQ